MKHTKSHVANAGLRLKEKKNAAGKKKWHLGLKLFDLVPKFHHGPLVRAESR
jgi:hypothetical protein